MSDRDLPNLRCVLCDRVTAEHFYRDDTRADHMRDYYQCTHCSLVLISPEQHLPADEEFKRYEMHENSPDDPDYRTFLNRMFRPMNERIEPGSYGLDFGSGPGPALHVMFEEAGHSVELFDLYYANDPSVFDKQYDFITSTETVEHLREPRKELDRLWACLKAGGWLGIMTKRVSSREAFRSWHYKNDDTHIIFFSADTFKWMGKRWGTTPEFEGDDVVLFNKPA